MELDTSDKQKCMLETPRGRVMIMGSAYYVSEANRGRDVVVNASFAGVLPARMVGDHRPRGAIGVDCGVGPDAAGIVGIYYLEALNISVTARCSDRGRPAPPCSVNSAKRWREYRTIILAT